MELLNEIDRFKSLMGLISEEEKKDDLNLNLNKIIDTLNFLNLSSQKVKNMLKAISDLSESQIIDFGLLERGVRKVLLKKGDKKKNIEDYFSKIISSLRYRERTGYGVEPESEDYDFDFDEPSIIPKKVYRKEWN